MIEIAVFELMSGKTVIARYTPIEDERGSGNLPYIAYELEKPMLVQQVRTAQHNGLALTPFPGLYPRCTLFSHAIAGENTGAVDKQMMDQYIRVTTGIQLSSSVPPPSARNPVESPSR